MSKLGLIIAREYLTRVRKKSFLLLTFLTPFLLIALIAVPLLLSMVKDDTVKHIAVTDVSGHYFDRLKSNEQYQFRVAPEIFTSYESMKQQDPEAYAYLYIEGNLSNDSSQVRLYSEKQIEMGLKGFLESQLDELARNEKINSYQIPGLKEIIENSSADVRIRTIRWDESGAEKSSSSELAMIIGMISTMIIYIFIFAYGSMVMSGVIEEKTNRIVEIIVSSVKPFELMMGKIIGIAMVGLTQVMLWILLLGGLFLIGGPILQDQLQADQVQTLAGAGTGTMMNDVMPTEQNEMMEMVDVLLNLNLGYLAFWFVLYFLGGYLLYASLFAAVGSAIDNPEDAGQFTLPLTIPVLFALYAGMYSASNPDGPLAFWCSIIPITSPIVMMVRLPFGVPLAELLLSFGLLVLSFIFTTKLASKIYRTGILMYGKKVSYKELWKWIRYKN
jgi:ABC-2 type transport system permease protein